MHFFDHCALTVGSDWRGGGESGRRLLLGIPPELEYWCLALTILLVNPLEWIVKATYTGLLCTVWATLHYVGIQHCIGNIESVGHAAIARPYVIEHCEWLSSPLLICCIYCCFDFRYRRVAGDTCSGGESTSFDPSMYSCPVKGVLFRYNQSFLSGLPPYHYSVVVVEIGWFLLIFWELFQSHAAICFVCRSGC